MIDTLPWKGRLGSVQSIRGGGSTRAPRPAAPGLAWPCAHARPLPGPTRASWRSTAGAFRWPCGPLCPSGRAWHRAGGTARRDGARRWRRWSCVRACVRASVRTAVLDGVPGSLDHAQVRGRGRVEGAARQQHHLATVRGRGAGQPKRAESPAGPGQRHTGVLGHRRKRAAQLVRRSARRSAHTRRLRLRQCHAVGRRHCGTCRRRR